MDQFGNQDFNMDYTNVSTEQMEIAAIENEVAIMEMMLAAGGAEDMFGFYDHNNNLVNFEQQINNLKSAEMPTWRECYPRGSQPIQELASFPPYRSIDFIAAAAPPTRTSFLPSPKGPKFSYIPEPEVRPSLPRLTAAAESGQTSAGGTLISLVSSSGRHSSERAAGYGGVPNGNHGARRMT